MASLFLPLVSLPEAGSVHAPLNVVPEHTRRLGTGSGTSSCVLWWSARSPGAGDKCGRSLKNIDAHGIVFCECSGPAGRMASEDWVGQRGGGIIVTEGDRSEGASRYWRTEGIQGEMVLLSTLRSPMAGGLAGCLVRAPSGLCSPQST